MLPIILALSCQYLLPIVANTAEPAPQVVLAGPTIPCVSFSNDGLKMAVGGATENGAQLLVYDVVKWRLLRTITPEGTSTKAVAFSADGRRLFAAVGRDVLVFEPSSGKELSRLKHHSDYVYTLAGSSDGKYLASGGEDGRVCLWDARTLKHIKELDRHTRSVHDLSLHPQSEQLVAGGAGGLFRLWKLMGGGTKQDIRWDEIDSLINVGLSPKGNMVAATTQLGDVVIADCGQLEKPPRHFRLGPNLGGLAWLDNERDLVLGINREATLFNAREGTITARFHKFDSLIRCATCSPKRELLAIAAGNGTIKVWNCNDLSAQNRDE